MRTQTRFMKETASLVLTLAVASVACNDASAFGRNKSPAEEIPGTIVVPAPPVPPVVVTDPAPSVPGPVPGTVPGVVTEPRIPAPGNESAGTYEEGLALGRRNGDILVGRLKDRTVGTEGCSALSKLQESLIKVTRSIRAPARSTDRLVAGFYRGYLDSVREAIRETRRGCEVPVHTDGLFAGTLYGELLCTVSSVNVEIATTLQLESLYSGWSGASATVISECRTAAQVVLKDCGAQDGLADLLSVSIETSCSDTVN